MIKAFMFGTKTNEKPAFNHETNKEEYITKVAMRILSPKADAIPYEHKEVFILSKEEYEAISTGETDVLKCKEYAHKVFEECVKFTEL